MTVYTAKEYANVLAAAGLKINPQMIRTMNRAAGQIKRDWRSRAAEKNPVYAKKYAGSIVMRRTVVQNGQVTITVEPRFGRRGQGPLGPVLEYGGRYSAAQRSNVESLEAELPNLLFWLAKIAADTIR